MDSEHQKAVDAYNILSNETFMAAVRSVDERIIAEWKAATDFERRELLHCKQQALREILSEIGVNLERKALKERREGEEDGFFSNMLKLIRAK